LNRERSCQRFHGHSLSAFDSYFVAISFIIQILNVIFFRQKFGSVEALKHADSGIQREKRRGLRNNFSKKISICSLEKTGYFQYSTPQKEKSGSK
jgi:hypothetical protein